MAETENNQQILQEEYLKNLNSLEEGSLVEGTVISTTNDSVNIDIGYKSDGVIPLDEFQTVPKAGDKIQVFLVKKETRQGGIELSMKRAAALSFQEVLKTASDTKVAVKGKISKVIKGGYEVDLGHGYTAFLPFSKADVSRVEVPEELLNLNTEFWVEKALGLDGQKQNIVVNRKDLMAEQIQGKREKFFETTKEGDLVEGVVKSFTSFGAFIDLGGFDGLLHINDMSWGHVTRPKDYVNKGDSIKLKVIKLDPNDKRINLSLKHFAADPWTTFAKKYKVEDTVKGKVTKLTDFGAFIELEEGIEGLAHISELSWVKRIQHPKEILKIGDEVEAKILDYDLEKSRISLGLKQVQNNPWDEVVKKYPVGKVLKLEVKKITNAGAFLTLEDGIDGFLHLDDISWTKRPKNLSSEFAEGDKIEVKILDVNPETRRISLGVKQISEDPWETLKKAYPKGSSIEGTITNKTEFGVFVRVAGGIEGLVSKSNLCDTRDITPEDFMKNLNVGDPIKVLVLEVSLEKQRLSLSIRDLVKQQEKQEMSKYIHNEEGEVGYTFGDVLKKK